MRDRDPQQGRGAGEKPEGEAAQDKTALEKKFGRKLNPFVTVNKLLIGGVRVSVGDEVLDTSVSAKLQKMHDALTA